MIIGKRGQPPMLASLWDAISAVAAQVEEVKPFIVKMTDECHDAVRAARSDIERLRREIVEVRELLEVVAAESDTLKDKFGHVHSRIAAVEANTAVVSAALAESLRSALEPFAKAH